MNKRIEFLTLTLERQLRSASELVWLGAAGIALGAACGIVAMIRGPEILPEGNLMDTAVFNGSVGIFMMTLAALVPNVRWTRRGKQVWTRLLVTFTLYAYGIETVQAFRGLDPRFSRVAGPVDQVAGLVFFLVALAIMVCFAILAVKYFLTESSLVTLGVRYGAVACAIAFGFGIWMSLVTEGRLVAESGNLLVVHAIGFHGLQTIPMVALLLNWSALPRPLVRAILHAAGLTWLGACAALGWQSMSGRAILSLAPATAAAALSLAAFALMAAVALGAWLQAFKNCAIHEE